MSHIWCTSVARHENLSEVSKKEGWRKEKRGGSGGQCAVCYLGLISYLTEHSKMERQREQWRESKATTEVEFLGKIYYRASHNDTANKTTLTAAVLAKHLETCDCSIFVAEVVGQLGKTYRADTSSQ